MYKTSTDPRSGLIDDFAIAHHILQRIFYAFA